MRSKMSESDIAWLTIQKNIIVFCREVGVVDMVHTDEFRLADEDEL